MKEAIKAWNTRPEPKTKLNQKDFTKQCKLLCLNTYGEYSKEQSLIIESESRVLYDKLGTPKECKGEWEEEFELEYFGDSKTLCIGHCVKLKYFIRSIKDKPVDREVMVDALKSISIRSDIHPLDWQANADAILTYLKEKS